MSDGSKIFAVLAGRTGSAVRGCYATEQLAKEHPQTGLKRNRVERHTFQAMKADRRFLTVAIDWDLRVRLPENDLDVPAEFEITGEHVGDSLVRVTGNVATGLAAEMNRQSLGMIRRGLKSIEWTIVVELGQTLGGTSEFELVNGDVGVCESRWQRAFRVVRPMVDFGGSVG